MNQIKKIILEKINAGEIAMRPRWRFMLETVLLTLGIIMVSLSIIYIASLVIFILQYSGAIYIPTFGMAGILPFLLSIPWTLLILALVFVIVLEFLVYKFAFVYRKPLLYSVLGIVVISLLGTFIVLQTSVHTMLRERAERSGLPVISSMYYGFGSGKARDILFGEIIELNRENFILNDPKNGEVKVLLKKIVGQKFNIQVGDMVLVFGQLNKGEVAANGLRIINDDTVLPLPPHKMNVQIRYEKTTTQTDLPQ